MRGIGSGYAQNQKLAGAQDPEAAAQLASLEAGDMQNVMERMEAENAALDEMREELLVAVQSSKWRPEQKDDKRPVGEWIRSVDPAHLRAAHKAWQDHLADVVDEESGEVGGKTDSFDDPFKLTPDHPAYQPIMDVQRRKAIEKTLTALDFGELLFKGYVEQKVTIRAGFEVVLRSISTQHGLWLEQKASGESSYDRHLFSLQQLAVGLHSAAGKGMGLDISSLDSDKDAFFAEVDKRMKLIGKWPMELSSDLLIHYIWFTGRVRKLLHGNIMEKVGN